ncbi:Non-specific lipid-transfer protein [Thalictrum thalictroides]|uniref:Non-specific lipid-transfer protein n=1 Tax=Thalictrum thalictroides TaxID=46969 RepID=A0A7J6XE87_THATH|nr:Non-specific lipid-transfer protein [Thalictrum thalictroides]
MGTGKAAAFMCFMVTWLVLLPQQLEGYISCGSIVRNLVPCIGYARNGGMSVPQQCCNGARMAMAMASSTPDRRQACTCIKNFTPMVPGIQYNLVNKIAEECGVSLLFEISPDIDCSM